MPWGLRRYQNVGTLHFITFSCYRRQPLLMKHGAAHRLGHKTSSFSRKNETQTSWSRWGLDRATTDRLSEFGAIFEGNLTDLLSRELLWRHAGWTAGLTEKAVQAGGRHNPE